MAVRITNAHLTRQWLANLHDVRSGVAKLHEDISSGVRLRRPSDDPAQVVRAMKTTDQIERYQQQQRNIDFARGYIETTERALASSTDVLQRIRELTVKAGNDTNDAAGLNIIATEVAQLKESLRQTANTRYGDDFVFAGTASQTEPFPPPANVYAGNAQPISRRIDEGVTVQVNRDGSTVFEPGGNNVFDLIDQIVADMQAATPAARTNLRNAHLDSLDVQLENILQNRATLGSTSNRLDAVQAKLDLLEVRATEELATVRDTDLAEAAMRLSSLNTVYEAALMSGSRMLQTSLVNFLL